MGINYARGELILVTLTDNYWSVMSSRRVLGYHNPDTKVLVLMKGPTNQYVQM